MVNLIILEKNKKNIQILNLDDLEKLNLKDIDKNILKENGLIKNINSQVKILGNGELNSSINIKVDFYSDSAKSKIEKAGGKADII